MSRRGVVVAVLGAGALVTTLPGLPALLPSAGAAPPARCDITQLETLSVALPTAPARVRPGTALDLVLDVERLTGSPAAALPTDGVEVVAALTGGRGETYWGGYASGTTGADGSVRLRLVVPPDARGPAVLDVETFRTVLGAPCASIEEHGRIAGPWGAVT